MVKVVVSDRFIFYQDYKSGSAWICILSDPGFNTDQDVQCRC
jgi:hypothetical protein